ncbi:heparinase [Acidisoma sp. L85]|uniref:heparinase n=1 Tax=Acidisoma sp. L85 TaxID=1641850 RepID=UPI00131E613A|nr:heparinase [Acidisoma sp. L85]
MIGLLASSATLPPLPGCANLDKDVHKLGVKQKREAHVSIIVDPTGPVTRIGSAFVGFSYEKSALSQKFFIGSNEQLIDLFRRLGPGILRLGGNSVDRTSWSVDSTGPADHRILPSYIDALSEFLQATNWKVLYGLNFASNTHARLADEAAYATHSLGSRLYAFEVGNEPDEYSENGLRLASFTYHDFISEWTAYATALRRRLPASVLTGPASAWHEDSWTVPFAAQERNRILQLTQHYYRGNGQSQSSTLDLLLAGDPALPGLLQQLQIAVRSCRIPAGYRLSEANSFYYGGATNVSNTFGSALWAIEFLFLNAQYGSAGVNFHGGGSAPGYTPIADNGKQVVEVRPLYYGMLLFSMIGLGELRRTKVRADGIALTAYAVVSPSKTSILIVNKDHKSSAVTDMAFGVDAPVATVYTLAAPSLNSTSGVTFNGASLDANRGRFVNAPDRVDVTNGCISLVIPPVSATLVSIK